jgi:hypothetical protein
MEKTKKNPIDWNGALREIASGGVVRTLLSVVLGFLVGELVPMPTLVPSNTNELPLVATLEPSRYTTPLAVPPLSVTVEDVVRVEIDSPALH